MTSAGDDAQFAWTPRVVSAACASSPAASYTDDQGAIREMNGQQSRRARVNLDYDPRSNTTVSISTMYRPKHDGSTPGQLRRFRNHRARREARARTTSRRTRWDGRFSSVRFGTLNGNGGLLYNQENEINLACLESFPRRGDGHLLPDGLGHVRRHVRLRHAHASGSRLGGRRAIAPPRSIPNTNLGNGSIGDRTEEALNGAHRCDAPQAADERLERKAQRAWNLRAGQVLLQSRRIRGISSSSRTCSR